MKMRLMALGLLLTATRQPLHAQSMAVVSGQAKEATTDVIRLFQVTDGRRTEFASTRLDAGKQFAFALPSPAKGFYYLTFAKENSNGADFIRLYLKPGEQVQLDIDKKITATLVKGGAENRALFAWEKIALPLRPGYRFWGGDTATYRSFFPALEAALPQAAAFKKSISTGDAAFDALLKMTVDADIEFASLSLLCTPRSAHPPQDMAYPAYYNSILKPGRYCSAAVLQLGNGVNLVDRYVSVLGMKQTAAQREEDRKLTQPQRLEKQMQLICNDTLKGAFLASKFYYFKTFEQLQELALPNQKYLLLGSDRQAYFDAQKAVSTFKAGTAGYNFSYPDSSGKMHSLKSMKGKVVLIDVWATWCGPCKAEIPYLQQLEEAMKGTGVEFVSISVDVEKDKDKWKQFVADKKLGGTQLFASGWSDLVKFYNITGIPRFMVFDKNGNIVSVDAPRPSTPDLKLMLEKALKQI